MVAQFQPQVTTASQIIYSYQDFDGTTVDIICMSTSPNQSQIRQAWTEENFDGETTHYLKTSKGKIVSSNWRNSSSNSWLNAYRTLWYQQRLDAQTKPDAKEHEEIIELDRAAELAKADLGFGW